MPLHPQVEMVLDLIERAGRPAYWELDAAEARAQHERDAPALDAKPVAVAAVEDLLVPGPGGEIPVRLYRPTLDEEPLPLLVWYHGGGHVVGSVACYDAICRHLAVGSGALIASVEYRLAPEHKFPAAVDDAVAVLAWAGTSAGRIGADPERIAVGGGSAGGNLAAVTTILARDRGLVAPVFQLLVYPATAPRPESESQRLFAEGHLLTRASIDWFQDHYVRTPADRDDFRFAPLLAPSLAGLPDALVIVAEYDPLRDEGIAYAERLRAEGAAVELACYEGMIHAFLSMSAALDGGREAIAHCARALRTALAPR